MKDRNTENEILEAALDVVKEKTISGTRMHLIAEKLDMVQSNLHYYFKTKDDLMFALQEKVLKKCLDLRKEDEEKAEDTLESHLDVFINQKRQFILNKQKYDYAEVDFWVQARNNPQIQKSFIESYDGWRADIGRILDRYVPDLSREKRNYIPYMIVSMLEGATIQYLINAGSFDLDHYFAYSKQVMLDMIYG